MGLFHPLSSMVKQKKTDRDKWYYAAKEQGYRSRAAFKLIQLNKKFNFLSSARACLDLCAAPGGWTQVAAKYMPVSSVIIGVDLFPIRPIRNVITLKEDITTQKCRHEIKKHLKGWKVDVCIHDGAPNLGSAWVQDAYGQNTLTLAAVGLAVDFLREGGTFVTKIFRSADYNSLLWVFNQLFKKVTVTKPPASRNTSAEIFAVCEGFLAPKQLDPRFLDPKHVFKELDAAPQKDLVFGSHKEGRNREGYDDDVRLLFKKASVADFITSENPTIVLANNHTLEFDKKSKKYFNDRETNDEIKVCCEDIKVLGKKELKSLLRWRLRMITKYHKEETTQEEETEKPEEPLTEEQEEQLIDMEIEEKLTRAQQRMKKKLKKERKIHRKQQKRIDMKMDLVGDKIDVDHDEDLFGLNAIKNKEQLEAAQDDQEHGPYESDVSMDESDDSDPEDRFLNAEDDYEEELEALLDVQYEDYLERATALNKAITKRRTTSVATPADNQMAILQQKIDAVQRKSIYDSDSDEEEEQSNPLIVQKKETVSTSAKAAQWFSQNLFDDVDVSMDQEVEPEPVQSYREPSPVHNLPQDDEEDDEVVVKRPNKADEDDSFEVVPMGKEADDSDMDDYDKAELLAMGTLIKKVAEAKARKKMKAKRNLDKVKQKANAVAEDNDLTEVAKARSIERLYKSQMAKMKTKQVYVVRGKGQKGKQRVGPKSSGKTRIKVVDKRMKADKRGADAKTRRRK